jgi:hypothetical protein
MDSRGKKQVHNVALKPMATTQIVVFLISLTFIIFSRKKKGAHSNQNSSQKWQEGSKWIQAALCIENADSRPEALTLPLLGNPGMTALNWLPEWELLSEEKWQDFSRAVFQ